MYWTTLSLFLVIESLCYPILSWVPFYSWIRFGVHLYLVLPGKQGSVFIYQTYIHPYLEEHEREIDHFITNSHDNAKRAGLQYLKEAIEWVKVNLLKLPPKQPTPPVSRNVSYSQALLSRFNMPSARDGLAAAGTSDLFSLLGSAMQQATYPSSRSRDAQVDDLSASGTLIPPHMLGEERTNYISIQRDRLRTLLQAFDKEAYDAEPGSQMHVPEEHTDTLKMSKSELEFDDLGDEVLPDTGKKIDQPAAAKAGGWGKWIWGNYGEKDSALVTKKDQ